MKSRISVAIHLACAALFVLLFANCRSAGIEDRLERLPTLPPDIASTLDQKTHATKVRASQPAPVRDPAVVLSACCGSQDQRTLQVRLPLTKCGPLRDFIVAPIEGFVVYDPSSGGGPGTSGGAAGAAGAAGARSNVRAYKLNTVNRKNVWDTIVCMTSDGPWSATLIEDRNCNGYMPQDSLIITAWGDLVPFYWNGGAQNHPPEIQLVSCREIGLFRYPCNALSSCDCSSSPCPADQPCDCSAQW
jgi:hypothetical protein